MRLPDYFAQVPRLRVRDPLAAFLGAAEDGVLEYGFDDVVKLAGHACPTVAGAYLMCHRALSALHGGALPERGSIRVELREPLLAGTTGVVASVATLLTGATHQSGFKGLAGRFDRRNLMDFEAPIAGLMRFTRLDTGARCQADFQPQSVAPGPGLPELMRAALAAPEGAPEHARFRTVWQERVRRILVEHWDDPALVPLALESPDAV